NRKRTGARPLCRPENWRRRRQRRRRKPRPRGKLRRCDERARSPRRINNARSRPNVILDLEHMHVSTTALPLQEVVEAQGHLIDSQIMERIFDAVVEFNGRFEVEQFRIGRTNSDPSYLRLKVEAPNPDAMEQLLSQL